MAAFPHTQYHNTMSLYHVSLLAFQSVVSLLDTIVSHVTVLQQVIVLTVLTVLNVKPVPVCDVTASKHCDHSCDVSCTTHSIHVVSHKHIFLLPLPAAVHLYPRRGYCFSVLQGTAADIYLLLWSDAANRTVYNSSMFVKSLHEVGNKTNQKW